MKLPSEQIFLRSILHSFSETGPIRKHNEDCITYKYLNNEQTHLIAVLADGMGGHNAGEVASSMACDLSVKEYIKRQQEEDTANTLSDILLHTHQTIIEEGNQQQERKGMGTTIIACVIKENTLTFAHVGDSRLYLYRNKKLQPLTKDHTLVQQMYERGEISFEQITHHPQNNVLLQAMGTSGIINPQISTIEIEKNDVFFLCSDGVYNTIQNEELEALMQIKNTSLVAECFRSLLQNRMASDNFSGIFISFTDDLLPATPITKEQNVLL